MASRLVLVEGSVWCDKHCGVHEDSTNPYDCRDDSCSKADHRKLYAHRRKHDDPNEVTL